MQKYELVLMLKSQIQESERNELLSKIEKDFKDNILLKDEMGIHETSYDIKGQKGNNSVYYVSYYLNLDNEKLQELRKSLLYTNALVRYDILRMGQNQEIFEYEKLQKELEKIMDSRDDKRFGNRVTFLSLPENDKYINWKAVAILKKYLTRFGNIKPRRYTKNCVSTQKKLRQEIIRARNFGLLEFIKK